VSKLARDGVASKRSITHAILGLFWEAYKPAFHIYRVILESFFYAYSIIVDIFVIVSFFLEKHYIPQYYRWLTCYVCAKWCQCVVQGGCYFRCDKPCTLNCTCTQRFLLLRSILICKSSARTKQRMIGISPKTHLEIKLGIWIYKTSFLHRLDDCIGFTPSCPPHILQQNCAHACNDSLSTAMTLTLHKSQVHCSAVMHSWACTSLLSTSLPAEAGC